MCCVDETGSEFGWRVGQVWMFDVKTDRSTSKPTRASPFFAFTGTPTIIGRSPILILLSTISVRRYAGQEGLNYYDKTLGLLD